ncbi:protein PHLOEM PROTEIN 2-LIKE A10-like [Zingiber officinale]|uniref:Protein PHLOEM PROTEIN 2-LIKE A10 n=1 Tax=Zingiber officinale TaxID=94328 RepID=A0A8J5K8P8_ZINOF|nr:protein PHLOEM PROTEIN 2-LIKE A10-like [Zingiber officinale]KAG6478330.1 hypothetical protein ZIOFF_061766 [Zingiber officinale]
MGIRLRRRRWILLALASAVSAYGAYRIYHLPSVARGRRKLSRVLAALSAAADAAASTAEAVSLVSSDLTRFLRSDSTDLPSSLKQITKIVRSDEFSDSVSRVSEALTTGIARGIQFSEHSAYPPISEPRDGARFTDRIMDRLFSASGSGLVSVMAGSFARGLVMGFYQSESSDGEEGLDSQAVPRLVQLMCRDESRELIGNCVQLFVSTAVTVYLEKTMEINAFDEFFSGLTNPIHEAKMKDMLVSVCNGAVQTLVKTSHKVLTSSNSSSHGNKTESSKLEEKSGAELARSFTLIEDGGGWVDQITSTLSVPGNRRFVLDVTGRITFETVRSFLDFVLWKMSDASRRGANGVKEELIRGLEVLRHLSARSIIIIAVCLCLCLHIYMRMPILTSDLVGN